MNKKMTAKQLKKGMEIHGHCEGSLYSSYIGYVKDVNPSFVTICKWKKDGEEAQINAEALFLVEMTENEVRTLYQKKAEAIVKALEQKLAYYEIGEHEQANGWISSDPWEMAVSCEKQNIRVLGYCDTIPQKTTFYGAVLDIGICAETDDGFRFWCHASSDMLKRMTDCIKHPDC